MENQPTAESQPQPTPAPVAEVPAKKKTSPWVWVIGGCLAIIILGSVAFGFFVWWGYNAAKDEFKKQSPNMEEFKGRMEEINKNADQWSQEADRMQKKAQELQKSIPAPEDMNSSLPALE